MNDGIFDKVNEALVKHKRKEFPLICAIITIYLFIYCNLFTYI